MRINETFNVLNNTLSTAIRRQYPLVYTQELTDSFDNLTLPEKLENSLAKIPYIEALPQYKNNPKWSYKSGLEALQDVNLLGEDYKELIQFMQKWKSEGVFFDPYIHQVEALRAWSKGSDTIVSTGTGSGKTECFLWPVVGHLHNYARRNKNNQGSHRGIKALILYPMNALVADQLKRLRQLLGRQDLAEDLAQDALLQGGENRPFQFGQYTGRTKFHGSYARAGTKGGSVSPKVRRAVSQFNNFSKIRSHPRTRPELENSLYEQMMDKGLIPSKGVDETANENLFWDMRSFGEYEGAPGKQNARLITEPGDRELFFRHEMHNTGYANLTQRIDGVDERIITDETNGGGTPDVLVTNYSMLEYMLKRPLEHGMFFETKQWLTEHPDNKLMLVLDEAHLYQGALGTEVGLLVRRLLSSLGILGSENENKVQFILTSASLGDDKISKEQFVHGLTGRPRGSSGDWSYEDSDNLDWNSDLSKTSVYIKGRKWTPDDGDCKDEELTDIRKELLGLDYLTNSANDYLLNYFLEKDETPEDKEGLTIWFRSHPIFRRLYMSLLDKALSLDEVGQLVFGVNPKCDKEEVQQTRRATEAILNMVAALKGPRPDSKRILPLLGVRAHLLYRGLPRLYWDLGKKQILLREKNSLDVAYPVRGCRQCGAPYASVWISQESWDEVRASIEHGGTCTTRTFSRPIDHSIRLEVYVYDEFELIDGHGIGKMVIDDREINADGPAHIWINTHDYEIKVNPTPPGEGWKAGYLAAERRQDGGRPVLIETAIRPSGDDTGRSNVQEITFCKATCLQCNTLHRHRRTDQITDYMTRGDDAFSQLMKELISHQNPDPKKDHLPNKGKKVMVFSDSRSRAAKLAKKIQDNSNYDELRLLLLHLLNQDWYKSLPGRIKNLDNLYSTFVMNCIIAKIEPFSGTGDKYRNSRNSFARTRVDLIAAHSALLHDKLGESFFEGNKELEKVVNAAVEEIQVDDKAINYYEEYYSRSPRSSDEFDDARSRYHKTSHQQYVKFIRRETLSAITRGVRNDQTGMSFSSNEKHKILGVCFDPEFYNETGEITPQNANYDAMIQRLNEMNISFETEELGGNSIRRFQAIMNSNPSNTTEITSFQKPNADVDKWTRLMLDSRELSLVRIKKLRDMQKNSKSVLFQACKVHVNSGNYTLGDLSTIASQIIEAQKSLYSKNKQRRLHWENAYSLANLNHSTPWDFSSAIMDFVGSKDFSLSSLGLGYSSAASFLKSVLKNKFLEDEDEEDKDIRGAEFDEHWTECLSVVITELIHWMVRPSLGTDSEYGKERSGGQRCIFSQSGVFFYHSMKSHPSVYTSEEEWGILPTDVENKYNSLISDMKSEVVVPFSEISSVLLTTNTNQDAGGRLLVKSEMIELKHLLTGDLEIVGCRRCGITMPKIHDLTSPKVCINCGYDGLISYDSNIPIFNQRIESPWREPAIKAASSSHDNLAITVLRAEEHTAQINTAKTEEEMYTSAEEFELLFQDVPFTVPEEDDAWTFVQSPVDILSCTTTMEVGIDIGSLTCVALRTIPRKASNYQQRVGRAGRGTAEVCVAISWCDNQPHAQNYFDNPREMLTHPKDSPVIYLNNHAIIERHINAAIFQAFFKRMRYNLPYRRFDGMGAGEHEVNLMESMGTLEAFFSNDDENEFSFCAFIDWIEGKDPSPNESPEMSWELVYPQIRAILPDELSENLEEYVENLKNFLSRIQSVRETISDGGIV